MIIHRSNLLILPLFIFAFEAASNLSGYSRLPIGFIFEAIFVSYLVVNSRYANNWLHVSISVFFSMHLLVHVALSISMSVNFKDLLISSKAHIYLVSLMLLGNLKGCIDFSKFEKIYRYLLMIFFFKYMLHLALGYGYRPGLFTENNFELLFLTICFLALAARSTVKFDILVLFLVVVLLSGSLSGLASAAVGLLLAPIKVRYFPSKYVWRIKLSIVLFLVIGAIYVFLVRINSVQSVSNLDRVVFLINFVGTLNFSNPINFLFGHAGLTPLEPAVCNRLNYYQLLFSQSGSGECYSVIYHLAHLRFMNDFGLVIYILFQWALWTLLRSKMPRNMAGPVFLVQFLNGMSVSAYYSVYFALSILVATLMDNNCNAKASG